MSRKILFLTEGYNSSITEFFEELGMEVTTVCSIVEFYEALEADEANYHLLVVGLYVALSPCVKDMKQRISAVGLDDFAVKTRPPGLQLLSRLAGQGRLDKTAVYTTSPELISQESEFADKLQGRIFDCCELNTAFEEFLCGMSLSS